MILNLVQILYHIKYKYNRLFLYINFKVECIVKFNIQLYATTYNKTRVKFWYEYLHWFDKLLYAPRFEPEVRCRESVLFTHYYYYIMPTRL